MSSDLIQIGATPGSAKPAPADRLRAPSAEGALAPSEKVFKVSTARPVTPAETPLEVREKVRQQIMAERGVDMLSMYRLGSQERIRAEAAILTETALRTRQARVKETGAFVDLRV